MGAYIGVVEYKNYYYNFKPIAEIADSKIYKLSSFDQEDLLPESRNKNINLWYNTRNEYETNTMEALCQDKGLLVFQFSLSDLEDNYFSGGERNPTGYRVDAIQMINAGRIKPLHDWGIFYVIRKTDIHPASDFRRDASVEINNNSISYLKEDDKVFVEDDSIWAGPYVVGYNNLNSSFYVKPKIKENKYTVSGYSKNSLDIIELNSNSWMGPDLTWSVIMPPVDLPVEQEDVISDQDLIEEFQESLSHNAVENGSIKLESLSSVLKYYADSNSSGTVINEAILQRRIERIHEMFSREIKGDQTNKQLAASISDLLVKYQSDETVEAWIEALLKDHPDLLDQLQGSRAIRDSIEKLNLELEGLGQEIKDKTQQKEDIEREITKKESEKAAIYLAAEQKADEELQKKSKEAAEQLEKNAKILDISNDAVAFKNTRDELKEETSHLEWFKSQQSETIKTNEGTIQEQNRQIKELESEIKDLFDKYIEENKEGMMSIAFDGFRSSKMLQAAARWEQQQEDKHSAEVFQTIKDLSLAEKTPEELVDYLCRIIKTVRPSYSRNTIINIAICITQGFLTVFSGEPGCGKTSICNIFGRVLGLDSVAKAANGSEGIEEAYNRYVIVSVERGWSSKRDFVGYYNPLSKQYDKSNRKIYNALKLLSEEKRQQINRLPYLITLDEANLSPMEYYWSDFMNICDDLDNQSEVNLGDNYVFSIPETLHFLATINNDQTTEALSPRLIDRAWIISLPPQTRISSFQDKIDSSQIEIISWDTMKKAFMPTYEELSGGWPNEVSKVYDAIVSKLRDQHIFVSPRVDASIKRYWAVASKHFEMDETKTDPKFVALDYAVSQRILPKILGSGEQFGLWLEEFKNYCSNQGMNMTKRLLEDIIERGNRQMKYYNFFC